MSLALATGVAAGALLLAAAAAAAPPGRPFELPAVRAQSVPVIDGDVGDAEWAAAAVASPFIQFEPRRGAPSEVRTEARVLYDEQNLYVAFRAWDGSPLTAQITQRDADLFGDDAVVVLLDSSFDRQSAFYFVTNPLGTQADGRVSDDGRVLDTSWDAPWRSAARRTDWGWSAELAIPLRSIKYAAGEGRTWGLNLGRTRRRSLEVAYWAGPLDHRDRVSQAGRLVGLNVPPPAVRLQVVPYALTELATGRAPGHRAGIDARFALTSEMALYGTFKPDFATIEADRETVNLTRFEISLPEKRQFFLEGQELFRQRIPTFYSRRIAGIEGGVKLLGRTGPWILAGIGARAEPDAEGRAADFAVGRVQRDLFGRSYLAVMAANRRLNGRDQGSVSLDTNLFFTKTLGFTGQLIQSHGPFARGSRAFFLRPSYDSPTGHFHVRYSHLGDRFGDNANAVGFVRDDDRRELDSALTRQLWPRGGPLERIAYDSNYNVYWSQRGTLRSWEIVQGLAVDLRSRWSAAAEWTEDMQRFESRFRNRQIALDLGYNTRAFESLQVGLRSGRNFGEDFRLWTAAARRKVGAALSIEYELERLSVNPDPARRSTWIHVARASQAFTRDLILRVFFQTNSAIDRRNVQAVVVWRYRPPFGTVQLAFQRGTAAFGERSDQGSTFFVKASAVF